MPKQNRPLVRDGRLQAPKKRTDRSYLTPASAAPGGAPVEAQADDIEGESAAIETPQASVTEVAVPARAASPRQPLPAAARAIQQQGIRKRRDVDVHALAERDTRYALHEIRRILIFATLVVATLIVLGIVLR